MLYLGDFKAGKTVELMFDTQVNGLPSTLSAVTVKVYKGQSTTTEVTTGVTHTENYDSITGLNHVSIDLSSDGSFYAAGNEFQIVMTAGTLGAAAIMRVLGMFSIENRVVNWAQVGSPTTANALSSTTISASQVAASVTAGVTVTTNNDKTGYTLSAAGVQAVWDALTAALTTVGSIGKRLADFITGDAYVRLGAPSGASVSADIAAINAKTTNLPASPAAVGSAMTLTSGERDSVADALLDRSAGIETGLTPRQSLRLIAAAEAGKLSGAATATVTIRNAVADSKARITATVDSDGNRSAVTTDVT